MGMMRPRIQASKAIIRRLHEKVNQAKRNGDIHGLRKAQGLIGVLSDMSYEDIATMVSVSIETVRRWIVEFIAKGFDCLKIKQAPGRPPKLTKDQKKQLKNAIKQGPEAAGYASGCWRSPLVQDFMLKTFKVFYSVYYVAQLLRNLGMSYQKARFASAHIDPKARKEWVENKWPEILRLSKKKNTHLLFGDEASFPQWGSLSYTWAPKGQQPIVKTSGSRRGYKVFGLIDYWTGKFFHRTITGKFNSDSYKEFLREVISQTRKHLIIIQDGARYHTSEAMMVFFYENRDRITAYQMPSYSPDYNPIEILWKKIKQNGVHLKYFPTFEDLMAKVDYELSMMAQSPKEVLAVFGFYTENATA